MDKAKIGEFIARKRAEKGLSEEELAGRLGITSKTVAKWEVGKATPDLSIVPQLCEMLGVSVSTLINGEENKADALVMKLLWVIEKLRQFRYAIIGLLITNVASQVESLRFFDWLQDGTFIKGFVNGSLVGLKMIGLCVFAYGLIAYISKRQQADKPNKA